MVKGSLSENANVIEVGVVQDVLENLVIVQSLGQGSPLDEDSLLCFVDREILGKVFETFGPVLKPLYSVRFNSASEIDRTRAVKGAKVLYVPEVCVSSLILLSSLLPSSSRTLKYHVHSIVGG